MRAAAALLALLIVVGGAGYIFAEGISYKDTRIGPIQNALKMGLDIKGGVRLVFEGEDTPEAKVTTEAMRQATKIMDYRVNKMGVSEPLVQMQGDRRIIVELADVQNIEEAKRIVGSTALLKFIDPEGKQVVTGRDLKRADVRSPGANEYEVSLEFNDAGAKAFAEATTLNVGKIIAIVLDDTPISMPTVQGPITGGQGVITGSFTLQEAQQLADLLNGGALPVKLKIIEDRTVSATLGTDSLNKSVKAGLIGLGLVVLFMIVYYRIPGLLAVFALGLYLMLTIGSLAAIRAVLTLPGIAGIILSLGMAVDANVIIFERIREELRAGRGLRSGIDAGFHRAFSAVLDANVTTIIAAAVLYYFGSGPIKGFGLTLGLGVLLSMFTAVTFSRWLVRLLAATRWFGKSLFGVPEEVQA